MKTSCIEHPAKTPLVIIRQDYLEICDNHCEAALLNLFEYWTNIKLAQINQAIIENEIAENGGADACQNTDLWIWKSQADLKDELLGLCGTRKIGDALTALVDRGFLKRRNNPKYGWDRTYQYRLDVAKVQACIMQKYRMNVAKKPNQSSKKAEAIPKTTPETTPENTSSCDDETLLDVKIPRMPLSSQEITVQQKGDDDEQRVDHHDPICNDSISHIDRMSSEQAEHDGQRVNTNAVVSSKEQGGGGEKRKADTTEAGGGLVGEESRLPTKGGDENANRLPIRQPGRPYNDVGGGVGGKGYSMNGLLPDTDFSRKAFGRLQANARAIGRRGPKRFETIEQKAPLT